MNIWQKIVDGYLPPTKSEQRQSFFKKKQRTQRQLFPIIDGKKQCSVCALLKPVDEFYSRPDGYITTKISRCKSCYNKNRKKGQA